MDLLQEIDSGLMEAAGDDAEAMVGLLTSELNDCREDERNAQNMIVQVIGTSGSILGILLGASFLSPEEGNINMRPLFYLSLLVFLIAFSYIITVGITNNLRFHYMRDLEDRLSVLVPVVPGQEPFVQWMNFSSPVLTRNIKHLFSPYTKVHYISYLLATGCCILFGGFMMIVLFCLIETPTAVDYSLLAVFITVVLCSFVIFIFTCVKSTDIYQFSKKHSLLKRRERLAAKTVASEEKSDGKEDEKKGKNRDLLTVIKYYAYPRLVDAQKPFLIVGGFFVGTFLKNGGFMAVSWEQVFTLFLLIFVADFLVYQARYQWNDLRGMKEDLAAGKTDRLPIGILGECKAVRLSLIIFAVRVLLAVVLIMLMPKTLGKPVAILCGLIFGIAVLYELASTKGFSNGVYFLVSFGYPIRIAVGMVAAWPEIGTMQSQVGGSAIPPICLVLLLAAFGFLGIYSAILAWVHKAVDQRQRSKALHKGYYQPLIDQLGDRMGKQFPLREKGKLSDHWNVAYLMTIVCLSAVLCIIAFANGGNVFVFVAELLAGAVSALLCCAGDKMKVPHCIICCGMLALKALLSIWVVPWFSVFILVCVLQIAATVLYFVLRFLFDPNFDFVVVVCSILWTLLKLFLGKNTVEYLKEKCNSDAENVS